MHQMKMSAGTAAQFMVSDRAIRRRPLSWWQRMQAANNGSIPLNYCHHRDYKQGTLVASAMERAWHNFFRDATGDPTPLALPYIMDDPHIPEYLKVDEDERFIPSSRGGIIERINVRKDS